MIEIKKLPSGFYAIFFNGTWLDAASATIEQAEQKAKTFIEIFRRHIERGDADIPGGER
jgi:hypothetical protein